MRLEARSTKPTVAKMEPVIRSWMTPLRTSVSSLAFTSQRHGGMYLKKLTAWYDVRTCHLVKPPKSSARTRPTAESGSAISALVTSLFTPEYWHLARMLAWKPRDWTLLWAAIGMHSSAAFRAVVPTSPRQVARRDRSRSAVGR